MNKKVILFSILLVISATCFIPVKQQKTLSVKASFYNVYQQLARGDNWKKWRADLRQIYLSDSTKISDTQSVNQFSLKSTAITLDVRIANGYNFSVDETNGHNQFSYDYTILPEKDPDSTLVTTVQKIKLITYIFNSVAGQSFSNTHISDLKVFMENPDLYYGYKINKQKVIDTAILVSTKLVSEKDKFTEAARILSNLNQYRSSHGLVQTQPLIAQFFSKNNNMTQIVIGVPVDKKAVTSNPISFVEMPSHGNSYIVRYRGKFKDKIQAYIAMQRYFNDKHITKAVLPFETYLENKLPSNDSDIIDIQINFPAF